MNEKPVIDIPPKRLLGILAMGVMSWALLIWAINLTL